MDIIAVIGLMAWLCVILRPGQFWQPLIFYSQDLSQVAAWPDVDIVVPARNESEILQKTLPAMLAQNYPAKFHVTLVDDHSDDGTAELARRIATDLGLTERLTVVSAPDIPNGWSGKVAAMQEGVSHTTAPLILFTDADISHPKNSLRKLVSHAEMRRLDLTSQMVKLRCESIAEKLLIPAFVFFFAMLYPFRLSNRADKKVAAAAGGVMLARRAAIEAIGGLAAIKSDLIDDCALARAIKQRGGGNGKNGRIDLTLATETRSLRAYPDIRDIWNMVARTAYAQLQCSPWLLAVCVAVMLAMFVEPLLLVFGSWPYSVPAGAIAWIVMTLLYMPTVGYYGLKPYWALTLPAAAMIYIGATIDSALRTWRGQGGLWKGRIHASQAFPWQKS